MDQARLEALKISAALADDGDSPEEVTRKADHYLEYLSMPGPVTLTLTVSKITYEQGVPTVHQPTILQGGVVQLTDTQQVTLSVAATDSKGQPTTDSNMSWTSADDTIISLQPAADGMSCLCVAGNVGTGCVVTVSDGTISVTDSFDVVPGGAATLQITEGTPEEQPPAAAPTGP